MAELDLRPVWPGFARCVRCRHIFLIEMLRFEFSQFWTAPTRPGWSAPRWQPLLPQTRENLAGPARAAKLKR